MCPASTAPTDRFEAVLGVVRGSGRDLIAVREAEGRRLQMERLLTGYDSGNLDNVVALLRALGPERCQEHPVPAQACADLGPQLCAFTLDSWSGEFNPERSTMELPPLGDTACARVRALTSAALGGLSFLPAAVNSGAALISYGNREALRALALVRAELTQAAPMATCVHIIHRDRRGVRRLLRSNGVRRPAKWLEELDLETWQRIWDDAFSNHEGCLVYDPLTSWTISRQISAIFTGALGHEAVRNRKR